MPSIEEQLRARYHQALVLKKLCDATAQSHTDPLGNEQGFWNGLSEILEGQVGFLSRLRKALPASVLNRDLSSQEDE